MAAAGTLLRSETHLHSYGSGHLIEPSHPLINHYLPEESPRRGNFSHHFKSDFLSVAHQVNKSRAIESRLSISHVNTCFLIN